MNNRILQMECIELQSNIQLKEKCIQMFLLDFYKLHLPKQKYLTLREQFFFFHTKYVKKQNKKKNFRRA